MSRELDSGTIKLSRVSQTCVGSGGRTNIIGDMVMRRWLPCLSGVDDDRVSNDMSNEMVIIIVLRIIIVVNYQSNWRYGQTNFDNSRITTHQTENLLHSK